MGGVFLDSRRTRLWGRQEMMHHPRPRVGGLYSPRCDRGIEISFNDGELIRLTSDDIIMVTRLDIHSTPNVGFDAAECYFVTFIYNEKVYKEWMTFPIYWINNFRDLGISNQVIQK